MAKRRIILREQVGTGLREPHEGPAFVHREPAAFDCEFHARAVLRRAAAMAEKKRPVEQFNVNATVLHQLDGVGDL
jgi:hypothetical protein